jgi:hypothetical protein
MRSNDLYGESYANVMASVNRDKDTNRGSGTKTYLTSHSDGNTEDNGTEMIPLDIINVESQVEVVRSDHPGGKQEVGKRR